MELWNPLDLGLGDCGLGLDKKKKKVGHGPSSFTYMISRPIMLK